MLVKILITNFLIIIALTTNAMEDQNQQNIALLLEQLKKPEASLEKQSDVYCDIINILMTNDTSMIYDTFLENITYYQNNYLSIQLRRSRQLHNEQKYPQAQSLIEKTVNVIESWADKNYSQISLANTINEIHAKIKNGEDNPFGGRGRKPGRNRQFTPEIFSNQQIIPPHRTQEAMRINFLLNPLPIAQPASIQIQQMSSPKMFE